MTNANQMVMKVKLTADPSQVANETLHETIGADKVEQIPGHRLRITYDVTQTSWSTIREQLQTIGAYSQTSLLARWRDNWREFIEQNVRDNLRHTPACCSKPPVGGGLRSRTHRE